MSLAPEVGWQRRQSHKGKGAAREDALGVSFLKQSEEEGKHLTGTGRASRDTRVGVAPGDSRQ